VAEHLDELANSTKEILSDNWQGRQYINFGPQFRIDSGNPEQGYTGSHVYSMYANNNEGEVCLTKYTQGGLHSIYNDGSIEIIAGNKGNQGGVDVCITGMQGSVVITAMENGDVLVKGKDIKLQAKNDIDIVAEKGNVNIYAGNKIDMKSKEAYCHAPYTLPTVDHPLVPPSSSFLGISYKGLEAYDLAIAAAGVGVGGPAAGALVKKGIESLKKVV